MKIHVAGEIAGRVTCRDIVDALTRAFPEMRVEVSAMLWSGDPDPAILIYPKGETAEKPKGEKCG